jgi:uncharacterized protein DUF6283
VSRRVRVPAQGCSTCPYRTDTPRGIWDPAEYAKLATYDEVPGEVPVLIAFHCHQQNATGVPTICRGWLSVHRESVAVRLAMATGAVEPGDVPQAAEPGYYASGTQAAQAGLAGVKDPGPEARKQIQRLTDRGVAK